MLSNAATQILVLEDELEVGRLIVAALAEFGFSTRHFTHGRSFLAHARQFPPDLAVLDLRLPDMDGLTVLRELQTHTPCAALILTGRDGVSDRILGLELGADDYLVKPFDPRELVARVRSILRRYQGPAQAAEAAEGRRHAFFDVWCFDNRTLTLKSQAGETHTLSAAEAQLLMTLLARPNQILSREQLLGTHELAPFDRSIDVRISRLRRRLGDDPQSPRLIKTVYGAGYLFCPQVRWENAEDLA